MVNYERGKIYKIICNETGKIYVGSTTESILARRLAGHKNKYKNQYLKGNIYYTTSFEIIKNGNYYIELICNCPCNSKDELHTMEGKYIREMDCVNKCIAGRTDKQYRIDNSEKIKESKKQYRANNSEKIKESKKQYRANNSEKIKESNKQYRANNSEKIKQYREKYAKDNSEKLKQKYNCECGGKYSIKHKSEHLKTIKHQKYLESI